MSHSVRRMDEMEMSGQGRDGESAGGGGLWVALKESSTGQS